MDSSKHLSLANKNAPYVLLETSFLLRDAIHNDQIDGPLFFNRCRKSIELGNGRARLYKGVKEDIRYFIKTYGMDSSEVIEGWSYLENVKEGFIPRSRIQDVELLNFFKVNLTAIGLKISQEHSGFKPLSHVDAYFGAYALVKAKKADVIVATADLCLEHSLMKAHGAASRYFAQRESLYYKLHIAHHLEELENLLDSTFQLEDNSIQDRLSLKVAA